MLVEVMHGPFRDRGWEWTQFSDLPDSYGYLLFDVDPPFDWQWHQFSDLPNRYGRTENWFIDMVASINAYTRLRMGEPSFRMRGSVGVA